MERRCSGTYQTRCAAICVLRLRFGDRGVGSVEYSLEQSRFLNRPFLCGVSPRMRRGAACFYGDRRTVSGKNIEKVDSRFLRADVGSVFSESPVAGDIMRTAGFPEAFECGARSLSVFSRSRPDFGKGTGKIFRESGRNRLRSIRKFEYFSIFFWKKRKFVYLCRYKCCIRLTVRTVDSQSTNKGSIPLYST